LFSFGSPELAQIGSGAPAILTGEFFGSSLALSSQGLLYGICGAVTPFSGIGHIYSLGTDGSGESVLANIPVSLDRANDGSSCGGQLYSGMVIGPNGDLFGTTFLERTNCQVFKVRSDGTFFQTVHTFTNAIINGQLAIGGDGTIFGVSTSGCSDTESDFIYRVAPDGTGYQVLHQFPGQLAAPTASVLPRPFLLIGRDGMLYGTTFYDGASGGGTVFRLTTNGLDYAILHQFFTGADNLALPSRGGLAQGTDGMLYGTTLGEGGGFFYGDIYKIKPDGFNYTNIYTFTESGTQPIGVIVGTDGALYGTAQNGGVTNANYSDYQGVLHTNNLGFVFRVNTDGTGFSVLHNFVGEDGRNPVETLVSGPDGALYGATPQGGFFDQGAVFRLTTTAAAQDSIFYFSANHVFGTNSAQVEIAFSGAASATWSLEAATNLPPNATWQTVATSDANGLAKVFDTSTNFGGIRLFRAVHP
jgi:uncharacterized repeat protein (TIGR03803 family)